MPRSLKLSLMLLDLAGNLDEISGLELRLQLGDDLVDIGRHAAEVAVLHAGIDVVDRLDIGLVGIGGQAAARQRHHVGQQPRHWIAG